MALSEAAIKRNKKRRSNSATGKNILGSDAKANERYKWLKAHAEIQRAKNLRGDPADSGGKSNLITSRSTQTTLGHPTRKEIRTSHNITPRKGGLNANTPSKENKVDKKSKENTTSKRTSNGTGLRANTKSKIKGTTKYKMVTAPHRNPTNKKIRVVDRPGKPRKKIMVNPTRGFKGGGKIYSVDNSGQKLVQKMYGGKIQN